MKNTNTETRETLQELYKEFKGDEILAATMKAPEKKKVDQLNAVSGLLWLCFFPRRDPGEGADRGAPGGVAGTLQGC